MKVETFLKGEIFPPCLFLISVKAPCIDQSIADWPAADEAISFETEIESCFPNTANDVNEVFLHTLKLVSLCFLFYGLYGIVKRDYRILIST